MKRNSCFTRLVLIVGALLMSNWALAQATWIEGQHYAKIKAPMKVNTGAKIEVLEVFSYACPHCGHFEPTMEKWRATQPKNAQFVGMPAMFHESWVPYARAYYASIDLKISHKTHGALFKALYEQNKQFSSLDDLANWYAQYGVTAKQFKDAFTASGMEARLKAANDLVPKYEVGGTPALVIDGKYKIEMNEHLTADRVPELINFLIIKAASERATNRKS